MIRNLCITVTIFQHKLGHYDIHQYNLLIPHIHYIYVYMLNAEIVYILNEINGCNVSCIVVALCIIFMFHLM